MSMTESDIRTHITALLSKIPEGAPIRCIEINDNGSDYVGWYAPTLDSDGVQEGWDKCGLSVKRTTKKPTE